MQHPWNNFATNYTERGSNFPPQTSMYPTSPSQPQPSFNRSPAPFKPQHESDQQPSMSTGSHQVPRHMQNGGYQMQQQPHPQQAYVQPQQYDYPPAPEVAQSYPQVDQSGYPIADATYPSHMLSPPAQRQHKNTREDPDMDEDFPSFKDIKGMFVKKQRAAEREERRSHTLPGRGRQLSGGPSSPNKPMQPEYLKSSMPIRQPALFQQDQQQPAYRPVQAPQQQQSYQTPWQFNHAPPPQPKNRGKLSLKMPASPVSPPKPRRSFSQVSQSPISPQPPITQKPPIFRQMSSGSGSAVLNMTTPPANQSGVYEIPVRHVSPPKPQQSSQDWHHVKPARDQINYRPPMSIQVPSYNQQVHDGSSPRVVITSNSPRSPQKAYYVGEGDAGTGPNWPPPRRASIAVASPGRILMMSGANNKPRRRASYAEITLSNNSSGSYNSLPRNFSVGRSNNAYNNQPGNSNPAFPQRSVIQVMSSPTLLDDGIELFPRQRRYGPPNVRSPQYYHTPQQQAAQPERGFARINMRAASVDRLLYQPAGHHAASDGYYEDMRQRQMGGWSVNIPVHHYGPQATQTGSQQGKTAAHLQYNSPMSLYSTKNAQQALDKDKEASELLKIVGEDGKSTEIINSPTLQAVLQEDKVKKQTGHNPDIAFYHTEHEYGPGIGPLRQYEETPDTLEQNITLYNQKQDKSLAYSTWTA